MPKLSKSDEKFLQAVGITPEPITSFDEERLALAAREIANLPKRAKLDLLTMITLQRLVKEFRASAEDNE